MINIKRSSFFFFILMIHWGGLTAQSWEDLNNKFKDYFSKADYKNAKIYCDSALNLAEKQKGPLDPDYIKSVNNLGVLYFTTGENAKAEYYQLKAAELRKTVLGEKNPDYASSLNNLGVLYIRTEKFDKAEDYLIAARDLRKELLGEKSLPYARTLQNLGDLYRNKGKYSEAESYYLQSLALYREISGTKTKEYADVINNMGILYKDQGDHKKAGQLFTEALEIKKTTVGENHPGYAMALMNLGLTFSDLGNYSKAEGYYTRAIEIYTNVSQENPDLANPLNNLGILYMNTGLFQKAEAAFNRSAELRRKEVGENHADYGQSMNNLGLLYQKMGDYGKAEHYYLQAAEIRLNTLGAKHKDYAGSLSNLATLYELLNEYEKALKYHLQALEIRKEALQPDHPDVASSLNNLARLYQELGKTEQAGVLYTEAAQIRKKAFGEQSLEYAGALNNLANISFLSGKLTESEEYYLKSLNLTRQVVGEENENYASGIYNLAAFYSQTGKRELAETNYLTCLQIRRKILGREHPMLIRTLIAISAFYQSCNRGQETIPFLLEARQLIRDNTKRNFLFLSESEKETFSYPVFHDYELIRSCFHDLKDQNRSLAGDLYDIELSSKGMVLNSGIELRRQIEAGSNKDLLTLYDELMLKKMTLSRETALPVQKRSVNTEELAGEIENLEKNLSRSFSSLGAAKATMEYTWKDVKKKLGANEAAIEFTYFRYHGKHGWTDSFYYGALVLRSMDEFPNYFFLCEATQLDSLLKINNTEGSNAISALYRGANLTNKSKSFSYGRQLYELVWKPLDHLLKAEDKIWFTPAGSLHKIAFAAVPYNGDTLLSDRYTLNQLSSSSKILNAMAHGNKKPESISVFGGIQYDASKTELLKALQKQGENKTGQVVAFNPQQTNGAMDYLPGTLKEANEIISLAEKFNLKTKGYFGVAALEESFKAIGKPVSPGVIHIATHGFFFPDPKKEIYKDQPAHTDEQPFYRSSDNPLNRSGLLFAGANNTWTGHPVDGMEDGILTAYEAANISLSETQLIVLSACETGLGDIETTEGVFGLQRAIKMAGAEYLIMSLWKVPDMETSEFMTQFYSTWFSGTTIPEAFVSTQQAMRKKYPDEPYKWAAFILQK